MCPLKSVTSISNRYTQIFFIVCVVVTSDMISWSLEFQSDSVCRRWVTGRPIFYNVRSCKFSCGVVASFVVAACIIALLGRATHYRESWSICMLYFAIMISLLAVNLRVAAKSLWLCLGLTSLSFWFMQEDSWSGPRNTRSNRYGLPVSLARVKG